MPTGGPKIPSKIRVAFVKFGGLSSGGTEKWLQMMAANLDQNSFKVTYFYCDAAPYIGSDYLHPTTDEARLRYLVNANVNLVKFQVGAKDVTREDHFWVNTNFWEIFDESEFDLVVTGKAGPAEYPFTKISLPMIEYVTLGVGVDETKSLKWSIHCSEWQRRRWMRMGGESLMSSSLPIPFFDTRSEEDYRSDLGIPQNAFVVGMHQRADDGIYSSIPLSSFNLLSDPNAYFLLLGGSSLYSDQAKRLGIKNFIRLPHTAEEELISRFLNTLDVFAHGRSDGETFGTVFAEAMSHGLPVVTHFSKDGANAQSETIGPAGKCVETKEQYAEFLTELINRPALYNKLSMKAIEFSESNYSLASISAQFESIILKVMGRDDNDLAISPLGFGRSPLGFLQYGDINNPSSIAHHIVDETFPEEYDLLIASHFLRKSDVFYDFGPREGLFCLYGALINSNISIYCFENHQVYIEQLTRSLYLNNWEDRVKIHEIGLSTENYFIDSTFGVFSSPLSLEISNKAKFILSGVDSVNLNDLFLNKTDLIRVDVAEQVFLVLSQFAETMATHGPVLLLKLANKRLGRDNVISDYERSLDLLFQLNYFVYRSDGRGAFKRVRKHVNHNSALMYVCIPRKQRFPMVSIIRLQLICRRTQNQITLRRRIFRKKVVKLIRKFGI